MVGIKEFVSGLDFVLGVNHDNNLYGWGLNERGQLAIWPGKQYLKPNPIKFFDNKHVTQLSCGHYHTLALLSDGRVYGWGDNIQGSWNITQTGYTNIFDIYIESFNMTHKTINLGDYMDYNYKTSHDFQVKCRNILADKFATIRNSFEAKIDKVIYEIKLFHAFDDKRKYNLIFVTNDDQVYGMGANYWGTLGLGHNQYTTQPELIPELCNQKIRQFVNGMDFILAITENDHVYSWGINDSGQLAFDSSDGYFKPKIVTFFEGLGVLQIACGDSHALALTDRGCVYGWGLNFNGEVGCGDPADEIPCPRQLRHYTSFAIADNDIKLAKCFSKEVDNLAMVNSDYCVLYNNSWFEDNKRLYIEMELCSDSLRNILDIKPEVFGRQSPEPMNSLEFYISCHIFRELLECVQYLHELSPPVIHRDLKPDNVLLARDVRNGRFLKVSDFGLATFHKHSSAHGLPKYIAPEVRKRGVKYNHKIDIYSLAKICELDIFDIDLDETT
ncbi:unnamed protein product [Oppiella nova]|uniref:Protein kinase domain-containing protein n=1 Tax=Oppiella nova TaxID=334625 RepID=A0A7R9LEP0_9ACAR|nr:unnamed protein product [Oppiella nova]CAG2162909.1 unnamed protein product [Oppiella nova]